MSPFGQRIYDRILTDLRMRNLDGQSLYREVAERWPEHAAGVVFITRDTRPRRSGSSPAKTGAR